MRADIVIIGGGPAGAAVGLSLLKLAPRLAERAVLVEAAVHPRDKTCGGGLTGDMRGWLRWHGLRLSCPRAEIRRSVAVFDGWEHEVPFEQPLYVVRRRELDAELLHAARDRGLRVIEGVAAKRVRTHDGGVEVRLSDGSVIGAQAVVAADGMRSRVARELDGDRRPRIHLAQCDVPLLPGLRPDRMVFDFVLLRRALKGYFWLFPCVIGGRPMVNAGLMQTASVHAGGGVVALLNDRLRSWGYPPMDKRDVRHWPEWPFDPRYPFAAPRRLTVGDAAGVEGLFGEGLSQCFAYGRLAAEELIDAFERGDLSFRGYRRRVLRSATGREMRMLRLAARIAYSRLNRAWINPVVANEHMARAVALHSQGRLAIADHPVRFTLRAFQRALFRSRA